VTDKKGVERRRYKRYEVKDQIFITFRPHFDRIGWITDISKGGVALEYSTIQEYSALTERVSVDIFSSPRKFDLSNLSCQLIYDARVDRGKGFIETIETRRCGLVFENLSPHQATQLEVVLNDVTAYSETEKPDSPKINFH
jgi:c-di-GMP-binding flagellar brake protein YcgR